MAPSTSRVWKAIRSLMKRSPLPTSPNGRRIPISPGLAAQLVDERRDKPYISNAVKTSKYNAFDFLPRQIIYQFTRLANAYQLLISILQLIPGFSTTGKFTTVIPLIVFLVLIIAKEGYYDWKRHRQDVAENNQPTRVLREAPLGADGSYAPDTESDNGGSSATRFQWEITTWKDLKVGDIIMLEKDEDVPADIVILHSDGAEGFAYIETIALDGETSLKIRERPPNLPDCSTIERISECQAQLTVEDPNSDLYRFDSQLTADDATRPLTINHVIFRGSTIRNNSVIGITINTGEECKIRLNSNKERKPKQPALESITNKIVLFLMAYVLISAGACTIAHVVWDRSAGRSWYLSFTQIRIADILMGFIIMFNNVIPLSLYVGLEGTKLGQMTLISNDLDIYHKETETRAQVNNTNNLDDLGQIGYVLSDKTGTLTENIMKLRYISVAGISWLHPIDMPDEPIKTSEGGILHTNYMLDHIRERPTSPFATKATRYLLAMALCHTCLPERTEDGSLDFQASSPDELALVRGARDLGFVLKQRSSQSVTVQTLIDGPSSETTFEILDIIEFNSKRKRMTIIVRCPDGRLLLICKGADSVLLPRLRAAEQKVVKSDQATVGGHLKEGRPKSLRREFRQLGSPDPFFQTGRLDGRSAQNQPLVDGDSWIHLESRQVLADETQSLRTSLHELLERPALFDERETIHEYFSHIDTYAVEGLRTLVYADKFLRPDDYARWKRLHHEAETSLVDRQERIEEVSDLLEQELDLVGASAVEDKLQKGVPETIAKLREANIKIWMLTGDKRETAISIAHSTRLCSPDSNVFILDICQGDLELQVAEAADTVQYRLQPAYGDTQQNHTVVVVDGETLKFIEEPSSTRLRNVFISLVISVDSVICCRASPAQKALLVSMIREGPPNRNSGIFSWLGIGTRSPLTLAIGDGANDISMISAANVGVGISGREGQQAARIADFSISQFRYLSKLLLVHGRWNYYRTTRFILATFWKETFIFFPQALFQQQTGSTGTSLYEPSSLALISFFTIACIIIVGTWEQDLESHTLMVVPRLYRYGQEGEGLSMAVYLGWFGNALLAGLIAYSACWAGYGGSTILKDDGIYAQGLLTFLVCVIWINYKLLIIELNYKAHFVFLSAIVSILAMWVYTLIVSNTMAPNAGPYSVRGGLLSGFGKEASWWCTLLLALAILYFIEMAARAYKQNYAMRSWVSRFWVSGRQLEKRGGGVREGFKDWEPRLWQEMEQDASVQQVIKKLYKEEY
ncbi:phospholipid-transporting atpase [Colletotrichum truncatum]|uniref:Phospholipid-transporting atpase n=1 Tax=Colletotrichum truncatum TaxID=5467 RepID=A0ACC3YD72_COLTU|nr:phospholipid-transporting atpase [Colletotrichum truncatum]KAF6784783.1 phospholipid-transporting atpase [Colletotrichum truncatum]